jgi:hypothetical protein
MHCTCFELYRMRTDRHWLHQQLVGFNINAFDLPFLFRRSWALGIAVPFGLRKGRYWSN